MATPALAAPLLLFVAAGFDVILAFRRASLDAGWRRPAQSFALSALLFLPGGAWMAATEVAAAWWPDWSVSYEPGNQRVELLLLLLNTSLLCGGLILFFALLRSWIRARGSGKGRGPADAVRP